MIYFETKGGLCNRLRGAISAYTFAKEVGQQMTLIWINDHELNGPVAELFHLPDEIKIINVPYIKYDRVRFYYDELVRIKYRKICRNRVIKNIGQDMERLKEIARKGDTYIVSAAPWFPGGKISEVFIPVEDCQEKINEIYMQFTSNTIGVHIRRTDNSASIANSPIEAFITRMEQEIERDSEVKFYVSTDSMEEKERLSSLFKSRVITNQNIVLSRRKKEGIKAAVIDLFLLGKTKKILGSFGSSFSEIAAELYGIPLIVVKKS